MPVQSLILYPDPRLRLAAEPVTVFDDALRRDAAELVEALSRVSAIGLAGPHVGWLARVVVLRLEPGTPASIYVNPQITFASDETAPQTEGSVSMPGVTDVVERAVTVRLRYDDLDGTGHEIEAAGFEAACLQHEIDQLDGIFWIERLSRLRRERAVKRYAKAKRAA
ncbi:peptide deformylase [Methylobacterium sp. Leaf93]|uniref:peptide deformylase n=1 Tax=Methylobacterium sp. Leaf93 TaxID=1736249 RepID=UPI0006F635E7|nr:peptide deformylase [Methylobacterium sp. Leaf93]KQP02617.1 peptide deformylase [Methylobacterium sp. Leaf93]